MGYHTLTRAAFLAALLAAGQVKADIVWNWSYSGQGVSAAGTLHTQDTANAQGYYQIVSIDGNRNGDAITGLQPAGTAIPGNDPFVVDNLIRELGPDQITVDGFGFSLASGAYVNPFFATFLPTPGYLEVLTQGGSFVSERSITFSATRLQVPEPASATLVALALVGLRLGRRQQRKGLHDELPVR